MLGCGTTHILVGDNSQKKNIEGGAEVDARSLATFARSLVADGELSSRWDREQELTHTLANNANGALQRAFKSEDVDALHDIHSTLFVLNELHIAPAGTAAAQNQFDPHLLALRNKIEQAWFQTEFPHYAQQTSQLAKEPVVDAVRHMWVTSEAGTHSLFDFLESEATLSQMIAFFQSDAALNTRFFDLLAFALIGSSSNVRKELIQNMWDEAGRGDPEKGHVHLFENLLRSVGVDSQPDVRHLDLGLYGLIGHNLFMTTCASRQHYFKSLGVMAITELMDPTHYEKLVRGCKRLGLGGNGELEYYEEHVTIDVIHGEGWLHNVIAPITSANPAAADEILFGAHLRLKTCTAYYDELQAKLALHK